MIIMMTMMMMMMVIKMMTMMVIITRIVMKIMMLMMMRVIMMMMKNEKVMRTWTDIIIIIPLYSASYGYTCLHNCCYFKRIKNYALTRRLYMHCQNEGFAGFLNIDLMERTINIYIISDVLIY